jgi:hypothetical protein
MALAGLLDVRTATANAQPSMLPICLARFGPLTTEPKIPGSRCGHQVTEISGRPKKRTKTKTKAFPFSSF